LDTRIEEAVKEYEEIEAKLKESQTFDRIVEEKENSPRVSNSVLLD